MQSNSSSSFKRPTIKEFGRAYVRLFNYFETPESWLSFLASHTIIQESEGVRRNGDCMIRVVDLACGELAMLGASIPNTIRYITYPAEGRAFWVEHFLDAHQARKRTWEVGQPSPSSDLITRR